MPDPQSATGIDPDRPGAPWPASASVYPSDEALGTWMLPPHPPDEADRVRSLNAYAILDTHPEPGFDDLAFLAATVAQAPIAQVSLVDTRRQWAKARHGPCLPQTGRDVSFCAHALLQPDEVFVVEDAVADPRFTGHPLVVGELGIRFYAGAPMVAPDGHVLGTVCVMDRLPRRLQHVARRTLRMLARQAMVQMEHRRTLVVATREGRTDPVTGSANARAFQAGLLSHWARRAVSCTPLAVLSMSVDGFRSIEDTVGPVAAAALLRDIAAIGRDVLPTADPWSHWDGDRFAAVVPGIDGPGLAQLGEALVAAVATLSRRAFPVSVSVGIASTVPTMQGDPCLLVHRATRCRHRARASGGGRVELAEFQSPPGSAGSPPAPPASSPARA